jgi:hypothetical protein
MFNNKTLNLDSMENAYQNYLTDRVDNCVEEFINDSYHFGKDVAIHNIDDCVQMDTYYADFGASKVDNYDENFNQSKSFTVFNQTKAKLVLNWNRSDKQPFNISPISCEIPPMKSYSFRVQFKPVNFNLNGLIRHLTKYLSKASTRSILFGQARRIRNVQIAHRLYLCRT